MWISIRLHRLLVALPTAASMWLAIPGWTDDRSQLSAPIFKVSTDNANPFQPSVNPDGSIPKPKLLKVPLSSSRALTVSVNLSRECYLGDMEAIILESGWSRDSNVRISIESLVPNDTFVATSLVSITKLQTSLATFSFTLPKIQQSTPMGLFICKDTARTGRCSDKSVEKFDELFARYNPLKHPEQLNPKSDIKDKSYFFGHLVAYNDSIAVTSGEFTEETAKVIDQDLSHYRPEERAAVMSTMQALHKTLGSLPLTSDDTGVRITLPSMASEGCSSAPKK